MDDERERDGRVWDLKIAGHMSFARGRLRFVNAHLAFRHGGPCDTDDGPVYLDLMLPFSVQIAHLDRSQGFDLALKRFRYWLPEHLAEIGADGFTSQWNELCEMRSIAISVRRTESMQGNILWMPTAPQIRQTLRPTTAEREAINGLYPKQPLIRGIGVIDPPTDEELRERDRLRKEAERRAKGVRSQASRTKNAEFETLAAQIDCSVRTLYRQEKKGTLASFLAERGADVRNLSAAYNLICDAGRFSDTQPDEAEDYAQAMAMLRDIAADPHASVWSADLAI